MSHKHDLCPICDGNDIEEKMVTKKFKYKNRVQEIHNYLLHHCRACDESFVDDKTIKNTEMEIRDFRREIDGLLTSDGIRRIRERFGYSQDSFGLILGLGKKTFNRYENGRVTQNKATDIMLRALNRLADLCPFALEDFVPSLILEQANSIEGTYVVDFAKPSIEYDKEEEYPACVGY